MTDVVAEQDLRMRSIVLCCTGSESGRRNAEVTNEVQLSTSLLLILEKDLLGPADPSPPLLFAPRETCTAMTTPGTDVSRNANSSIVVLHVVDRERSHDNAVCLSSAQPLTARCQPIPLQTQTGSFY